MKVLTYVNGILTVIRDDDYFMEAYPKPTFIDGKEFYYEPTLKLTNGRNLTPAECSKAEAYIAEFTFPEGNVTELLYEHCVDIWGNYLGYKIKEEGNVVVPTAPDEIRQGIVWDFVSSSWIEVVLVNSLTGDIMGSGINTLFDNAVYVPLSKINPDFCLDVQTYDFSSQSTIVHIEKVRAKKEYQLKFAARKKVDEITGVTNFGEISSWKLQEEEALNWVKDNEYSTPFLDALLISRSLGETKADLVNKIIQKSTQFKVVYATHLGKFHYLLKAIEQEQDIIALKNIVVEL